jgi:hypothetical protein
MHNRAGLIPAKVPQRFSGNWLDMVRSADQATTG